MVMVVTDLGVSNKTLVSKPDLSEVVSFPVPVHSVAFGVPPGLWCQHEHDEKMSGLNRSESCLN